LNSHPKGVKDYSWIRPGARQLSLASDQKTDEESLLPGELNSIPSRRKQPNQRLRTYNQIQYSNRPKQQQKKNDTARNISNQRRNSVQPMYFKIQIDTTIASN
jgi:hypothetical protein